MKIALTAKASSYTSMAMFMMVFGQTTKQTVQVPTNMSMVLCTKVNGKTTYNMARVLRPGLIKAAMKVNMLLAESMESEVTNGMTEVSTLVIGVKIRLVELASTLGWMGEGMKASGWITTWKALASTSGMTEECIKVNTRMIKSTDTECILGQMVVAMKDIGLEVSSMDWEPTSFQKTVK